MGKTPDLSEFFRLSKPKNRPCAVAYARKQIDGVEGEQLDAALSESEGFITNAAVRDWLAVRGHTVNAAAISVHRKGSCSCGREA